MKLKLLALAAAAIASTGAYAQSSVTLYGVADVGIEYLTDTSNGHDAIRMSSGNMSGSRWGLRGVEDLGGGLKGVFTLEGGFEVDTGTSGDRLFGRQAYVGLAGGFGSLTLGRHQTPLYDFSVAYDPMGLASRYSLANLDGGMGSRADNSIKYSGTFGGLTVSALYSFGYGGKVKRADGSTFVVPGEVPGDADQGSLYSAGLNYAAGPFAIGAVYERAQLASDDTFGYDTVTQRAALAASYAVGPAKIYGGYRWAQLKDGGSHTDSNLGWLGLGYQATPALLLTGAVYYKDVEHTDANAWMFVASADYALSKRTDLYMNLAYALNSDGADLSLGDLGVQAGKDQFGAVVGVRHKF